MDIKELKSIVYASLNYKNLDLKQYKYILKLLDSIRNDDDMKKFYCSSMGKLLLKQDNFEDAKYYFFELLSNYPDYIVSYYQFYKIDIYEHNFIDAYLDLFYYKQNSNSDNMDITLPLTMLELCLDLEYKPDSFFNSDYTVSNTSRYFNFTFEGDSNCFYNEAINSFNNRDYDSLQENLIKLANLIEINDLPVDINPIIMLAEYIKNRIDEIRNIHIDNMIDNGIYNDEVKNYLVKNLGNKKFSKDKLLKYINRIINTNAYFSEWLLINFKSNYNINDDNNVIEVCDYLQNKITEEINYLNLTEQDKEIYKQCIELGRQAYKNHELDKALEYYEMGKQNTNHSIFNYYMGKMYHKKRDYDKAYEILSDYEKHGGNKLLQTLLYLYTIDKVNNRYKNAKKRLNKINMISLFIGEEWNIRCARRSCKNVDIDHVKKNRSKYVRFSEEIFNKKTLSIEEYYDYSFYDKLEVIKQLYQSNRIKMADNLMKELEREIDDSTLRKVLNREKGRKTLYLNQAKKRI